MIIIIRNQSKQPPNSRNRSNDTFEQHNLRANERNGFYRSISLTENIGRMREDGAEDPQIASRNRHTLEDRALVAFERLRSPGPIEPHPEPRSRLLLALRGSNSSIAGAGGVVRVRVRRRIERLHLGVLHVLLLLLGLQESPGKRKRALRHFLYLP